MHKPTPVHRTESNCGLEAHVTAAEPQAAPVLPLARRYELRRSSELPASSGGTPEEPAASRSPGLGRGGRRGCRPFPQVPGRASRGRHRANDRHEATATSGRLHRPGAGGDAAARRAGRQPRRPSAARRPVRRRPGARPALREADPAARTLPAVGLDWAVSAEALARRVRRARPGQLRRGRERQRGGPPWRPATT